MNENEKEIAEAVEKARGEEAAQFYAGWEEGWKVGREEGKKEGIKEGEKIGSHNAMMSSARTMLEMNIPIDQIAYITKLPETSRLFA